MDPDLPERHVTADQVVAANIRRFRRAARMTQAEAGAVVGWSAASFSAAEKSADPGHERRRFDAQAVTDIAAVLGVPVSGLFLPPGDDGTAARYLITAGGTVLDMSEYMTGLVMPDSDAETPQAAAYRDAFRAAAYRYLSPEWAARAAGWLAAGTAEERADVAGMLREDQQALMRAARRLGDLAAQIEGSVP